jgi:hypothetical protein
MSQSAICGMCLRVRAFANYREAETADCDGCGEKFDGVDGPFCPCGACLNMVAQLEAGGRSWPSVPMLREGRVIRTWTPEDGATWEQR